MPARNDGGGEGDGGGGEAEGVGDGGREGDGPAMMVGRWEGRTAPPGTAKAPPPSTSSGNVLSCGGGSGEPP